MGSEGQVSVRAHVGRTRGRRGHWVGGSGQILGVMETEPQVAGAAEEPVSLRFLAQTSPETQRIREDGQLSRQCLVAPSPPRRRQCRLAPQLEGVGKAAWAR